MAQINFPTATSNGQTFEADNGVIYTYVGTPPNGFWSGSFQATGLTTLDARFLKLDSSNDPVTGGLNITGGNVGIGESNPSEKLEVAANGQHRIAVTATDTTMSNGADYGGFAFFSNDASSPNQRNWDIYQVARGSTGITDLTIDSHEASDIVKIKSSGNVGIGTSGPSSKLEVNGFIQSSQGLKFNDTDSDYGLFPLGSQTLAFNINGDEKVRIAASGNVGIGTNAPSTKVEISDSSPALRLSDSATIGTSGRKAGAIEFYQNDASGGAGIGSSITAYHVNQSGDLDLRFQAGNDTERMRITSSGNVGIGTTSPGSTLEVQGSSQNALSLSTTAAACKLNMADSATTGDIYLQTLSNDLRAVVNGGERIRITSSGRVGIGTSSPGGPLEVQTAAGEGVLFDSAGSSQQPRITLMRSGGSNYSLTNSLGQLVLQRNNGEIYRHITSNNTHRFVGTGQFNKPANWWSSSAFFGLPGLGHFGTEGSYRTTITCNGYRSTSGWVSLNANAKTGAAQIGLDPIGKILFGAEANKAVGSGGSPTARMIIDSNGDILIHQFSSNAPGGNNTTTGSAIQNNSDGTTLFVSRGSNISGCFNRNGNGDILQFRRNGAEQGDIRVSGSTVTYAGGHLSRFAQLKDNGDRIEILRGSVLSNIDQMCVWDYDAKDPELWTEDDEIPEGAEVGDVKIPGREAGTELNEQLNRMKVSDVEGDPNVSGVFEDWDDDDEIYTKDFFCAMTGDFVIRIAKGTTVARGDLLMSAGDGTAKPQEDDIVRSKTIAKVSSTVITETYADGSYIVPCVLMAC